MITLIATLKVKEGKMDEFKEKVKQAAANIKKNESGCVEYIPHTLKGDANAIVFYEKYTDKDALKIHSANLGENFKELLPLLEPVWILKHVLR